MSGEKDFVVKNEEGKELARIEPNSLVTGLAPIMPKPGWKSTEWLGFILVVVIAGLLAAGLATETDALVKLALVLGPALASGAYSMSRGKAKSGN